MFVVPLGLKAKPRRIPWATFTIVLVTVLFSVYRFESGHLFAKELLNSERIESLVRARSSLLRSSCNTTPLPPKDCEFISKQLESAPSMQPLKLQARLLERLRPQYGDDSTAVFNSLAPLLFEDKFWLAKKDGLRDHADFKEYLRAKSDFDREQLELGKRYGMLSRANLGGRSLAEAQLTHEGWLHLIGNMLFFILLAIAAEERVGPITLTAVYVAGGTFGLVTQLFAFPDPAQTLLGASANVSAIIGLFMILFWTRPMRIWLSAFFVWNREVIVPTWIFIPFFMVSMDITGSLAHNSRVAHLAHLGGLVAGAAFGLLIQKLRPLPAGCIFPFEAELYAEAEKSSGDRRLQLLNEVLYHHPENPHAQELAYRSVCTPHPQPWSALSVAQRGFLKLHFGSIFNKKLSEERGPFVAFIASLPEDWPLGTLVDEVDLRKLRSAEEAAEECGELAAAIRLLEILRDLLPEGSAKHQLGSRISALSNNRRQLQNSRTVNHG